MTRKPGNENVSHTSKVPRTVALIAAELSEPVWCEIATASHTVDRVTIRYPAAMNH